MSHNVSMRHILSGDRLITTDTAQLNDVHAFIARARQAATPQDLNDVMQSITREMGFDHFTLAHHLNLNAAERSDSTMTRHVALSDYPQTWMERSFDGRFSQNPVRRCSYRTSLGFAWDRIGDFIKLSQEDRNIVAAWAEIGIGDGYTVGTHLPGEASGSCSFTMRTGRQVPRGSLAMAHLIGSFAFQAGREMVSRHGNKQPDQPQLTTRQLECIILVARGKTDWEIARVLGISEETVKQHLKDARARYDVSKRVQVVLRVVRDGLVSLNDLL